MFCIGGRRRLPRDADRLHPFLLSQLKRATDHASQDSATASPSASAGVLGGQEGPPAAKVTSRAEMHPVLYPILLLLARLRASGGAAETEAEQNEVKEEKGHLSDCVAIFPPACRSFPGHRKHGSDRTGVTASICRCGMFPVVRGWMFGGSDTVFCVSDVTRRTGTFFSLI